MPATRLSREDAGKMIDQLNKVSDLMEELGLEYGAIAFDKDGSYTAVFNLEDNEMFIDVVEDGKSEKVKYRD